MKSLILLAFLDNQYQDLYIIDIERGTTMKREDRKAASALKKDLKQITKPLVKPYGFKFTSGRIWTVQGDLILEMIPLINITDEAFLHTTFLAKPLFADDCLWDILGLEENKKSPMSLRVTGAFTAPAVRFHVNDQTLKAFDTEEVERYLQTELDFLAQHIASVSADGLSWFYKMESEQERYFQCDVMKLVLLLHDNKKDEALAYIDQHQMRDFNVNGKSLKELATEYCRSIQSD